MSTVTDQHPDTATFEAFRCGKLDYSKRAVIQAHLAGCRECTNRLTSIKPGDAAFEVAGDIDAAPPGIDVPPPLVNHPRYKIVGRLGEGGMGVVYKAEHRVMGRTVALKVLTPGTMTSQIGIDRFRREVRLASRLSHPNIVTAFDAEEAGGLHFLVMECVDGSSLERVVRDRGPLPIPMACAVIRQTAIGLQHAHEKGMVHRDIKPHNLMLTPNGQVKILDFGLARVANTEGVDPSSLTAMAITNPQTLVGTPDFLSPEQARSSVGLDIRSDLYSLGCTFYYLVTGKPPFGVVGAYAKMIAHFKEPSPRLCEVRHDVPVEVDRIYQKLMAKSPEERYQTPNELATAVQPFTGENELTEKEVLDLQKPNEAWLANGQEIAFQETLPSYSTAPSLSLPMASEFEASASNRPPIKRSQAEPRQPKTVRNRKGLAYSLAALVVLGVGLGAMAKWLTGSGEPASETLTQTASKTSSESSDKELTPTPKPTPVPEVKTPATTPFQPVVGSPKPAPKTPVTTPSVIPVPLVQQSRKKQVLLLVPPEYAFNELTAVTDAFKSRETNVITASFEKKMLEGIRYGKDGGKTFGGFYTPDFALKDLTPLYLDSLDAIILLPGEVHTFTERLLAGPVIKGILEKAIQKKKVIGAIGSGEIVLGKLGLLEHAEVSSVQSRTTVTSQLKVKAWKDDPKVVVDLPFITSGDFSHTRALVDEVLKAIPENVKK